MTTGSKSKYKNVNSSFEEVGRVKSSDINTVVVSKCVRNGEYTGRSISKYIDSEGYTGWAKGAVFVPEESTVEFLLLFDKGDLEEALAQKVALEDKNGKI